MKKFTKGCLISALVLFIFGAAFWGIFGVAGGFAQLEEQGIRRAGKERLLNIGWHGFRLGDFISLGDWEDEEDADWEDVRTETVHHVSDKDAVQTDYRASDITEIDIELGGVDLVIGESDDEFVWIKKDSSVRTLKYGLKDGKFRLEFEKNVNIWHDITKNGTIYLYLPENLGHLNEIDIEVGAGIMECSVALEAVEIDIDAGAGNFIMTELSGENIALSAGAASVEIDKITAAKCSIESGAGAVTVDDLETAELDLETGAGGIEITGSASKVSAECAAGSIDLTMQGMEADYNYELECAIGSIQIGDSEYSGLAREKTIDNRAGKWMEIECSAGSVEIGFTGK